MKLNRCASVGLVLLCGNGFRFLAFTSSCEATTIDNTLPVEVVEALENNAQAFDPIILEWVRERTKHLPAEKFFRIVKGPKWVKGDTTFLSPQRAEYRYERGKVHVYYSSTAPLFGFADNVDTHGMSLDEVSDLPLTFVGTAPMEIDIAFDGKKFYQGSRQIGGVGPPHMVIETPGDFENPAFQEAMDWQQCPAFFWYYAGLKTPFTVRDYQWPKMRSLVLDLLARGGDLSQVERETNGLHQYLKITLVTEDRVHFFDLDQSLNYAVRRQEERTPDGKTLYVSSLSDFHLAPSKENIWLPHRCVVEYYQWQQKPPSPTSEAFFTETYTVTKCESRPIPDGDLEVFSSFYIKPGARIADGTLPNAEKSEHGQICYTVPIDLDDLDKVIQAAIEGKSFTPSDPTRRRLIQVFVLVNVLVIAVVLFWVWRSRSGAVGR